VSSGRLVIAIDGPAGSGKSTTARLVAGRLGYLHVDTGAMYRAFTLKLVRAGIRSEDRESVRAMLATTKVALERREGHLDVLLDGENVTREIRSAEVTRAVSAVSSIREVRDAMVTMQRALGAQGGIVLEGRDIGTVVFPDADLKIFMVAGIEARARRRMVELRGQGVSVDLPTLAQEIGERDRKDSTRTESPLRKADGAVELDTTDLSIEEQVAFIVERARVLESGGRMA
jgi:cytidylate kinase